MSHVQGTSGAMLQGVSQQPRALRAAGQVTEQINYDSDVSTGLTSRPGTTEIAKLVGSTADMRMLPVNHGGNRFIVGYSQSTIKVWTVDGVPLTVTAPDGTGYLGNDMVFQSDSGADHIKCLNREVAVSMLGPAAGWPIFVATVSCLGGIFLRDYTVRVSVASGESAVITYTTPAGDASGDAALCSATAIAAGLQTAWAATTLPAAMVGITAQQHDGTVIFRHSAQLFVTVDDDEGGTSIRVADNAVKDPTHLPVTTDHGHTVRVQQSKSEDDDYYLQFQSNSATTFGTGFGSSGVWREVASPLAINAFDLETMPHRLVVDVSAGTAVFQHMDWFPRRCGDDVTNTVPAFVGTSIRDLGVFEGRLVAAAGDAVRMSRTNEPTDMWKKSATVQASDDPIEIRSTATSGAIIDWIVPFDGDLLLVSDPGAAQFVVTGGGLTPSNASMVLSTEYDVDCSVRPVSTGRTIMLPFKTGSYVGVNEFFTRDAASNNAAEPITAVQDRYIVGRVTNMQAAENFSRVAISSDGAERDIVLFRYLWNAQERIQSSWHRYTFADKVRTFFFDSSFMHVVLRPAHDDSGAVLVRMDMNRVEDAPGFHITLDRKTAQSVSSGAVVANYADPVLVQGEGCASPGLLALIADTVDNLDGTYTVIPDSAQCPEDAEVVIGQTVQRTLVPTMPVAKDSQGNVVSLAGLSVRHFYVRLDNSGDVQAVFSSPYREDRVLYTRIVPMDNEPLDPERHGTRNYVLNVPWRDRADLSELKIVSNDVRPDTILEIEWAGDIRGVRRRI